MARKMEAMLKFCRSNGCVLCVMKNRIGGNFGVFIEARGRYGSHVRLKGVGLKVY